MDYGLMNGVTKNRHADTSFNIIYIMRNKVLRSLGGWSENRTLWLSISFILSL